MCKRGILLKELPEACCAGEAMIESMIELHMTGQEMLGHQPNPDGLAAL